MLHTELILSIAEFVDWQTLLQLAGTCRELRKRILSRHWNVPFVMCATNRQRVTHLIGVLSTYKFDHIDISGSLDSERFDSLGRHIGQNFDEARGHVSLATNSFYLLNGMASLCQTHVFDKLAFDIIYEIAPKLPAPRTNVRSYEMFPQFREVSFRIPNKCADYFYIDAVTRDAIYAADCDIMRFYDMEPSPMSFIREMHMHDTVMEELYILCRKLFIHNSKISIFAGDIFDMVEEVHIDEDSVLTIPGDVALLLPNAIFVGDSIDRVMFAPAWTDQLLRVNLNIHPDEIEPRLPVNME